MTAKFKNKNKKTNSQSGFTLVELLVTVTLMAAVNGLILASVPEINKRIGLKRTAGEIAMVIRQAQAQALGIKEHNGGFPGYGVHFDKTTGNNKSIILFADAPESGSDYGNGEYDAGSGCGEANTECIQEYKINTGDWVEDLCAGTSATDCEKMPDKLDIVFNRATPFSSMIADGDINTTYSFAKITIESPRSGEKNKKRIQILSSGQVEIK